LKNSIPVASFIYRRDRGRPKLKGCQPKLGGMFSISIVPARKRGVADVYLLYTRPDPEYSDSFGSGS